MYEKNLGESVRLRLSSEDMNFLRDLSEKRSCSVSECIRSILGEYRRALETMQAISDLVQLSKENGGMLSHGDTKTDLNDKLQQQKLFD